MEHGVVTHFPPTSNHGFAITPAGEKVFLHRTESRSITADGDRLKFAESPYIGRIPQRGDRIVFERTHNPQGLRASPWGFHEEFRSANSKLFSPLFLSVSLTEHPYLLDIFAMASRFKEDATYKFQNRRLTIERLQKRGYDDLLKGDHEYYYAVDMRGPTRVYELKSEIVGSRNGVATRWEAEPIITQLFKLQIPALDQNFRLVKVSIRQEPNTGTGSRIQQKWLITVYKDQAT